MANRGRPAVERQSGADRQHRRHADLFRV